MDFDTSQFFPGIALGIAGALLFALPMLMTMEMWQLGVYMDRTRLLLLLLVNIPLLIILADRVGFEETSTWRQAVRDASIAYAPGIVCCALILVAMGVIKQDQSAHEIIGMIALRAVPASIGAMLVEARLVGSRIMKASKGKVTITTLFTKERRVTPVSCFSWLSVPCPSTSTSRPLKK